MAVFGLLASASAPPLYDACGAQSACALFAVYLLGLVVLRSASRWPEDPLGHIVVIAVAAAVALRLIERHSNPGNLAEKVPHMVGSMNT